MTMPGRNYNAGSGYRYGFNGKENDKDISEGAVAFEARIYDGRIGRWLSVDKLSKPSFTPYLFSKNNPINFIDPDGNDEIHFYYFLQQNWDGEGRLFKSINVSTQIIANGNRNHTFFIHNQGALPNENSVTQIHPFLNGTNLPNQRSFCAAENGLPLASVTKYLYFFSNQTDDYEFLGRLLQIDPSSLEYYKYTDKQWGSAFYGSKAQAKTAEFAKTLVGISETIFAVIDGYYFLRAAGSRAFALLEFRAIESGGNIIRSTTFKLRKYEFKSSHAFDKKHTIPHSQGNYTTFEGSGLSKDIVETNITKNIDQYLSTGNKLPVLDGKTSAQTFQTNVNGFKIEYKAGVGTDGSIKISDYYIK